MRCSSGVRTGLTKAALNQLKHRIFFEEAATVFGDPLGRTLSDPEHSRGSEPAVLSGLSKQRRMLTVMFVERAKRLRIISARLATRRDAKIMRKTPKERNTSHTAAADEILPEYDFRAAARNKYAAQYTAGSTVVVLDLDVALAFPTSVEVNDDLRALADLIGKHKAKRASARGKSNRGSAIRPV